MWLCFVVIVWFIDVIVLIWVVLVVGFVCIDLDCVGLWWIDCDIFNWCCIFIFKNIMLSGFIICGFLEFFIFGCCVNCVIVVWIDVDVDNLFICGCWFDCLLFELWLWFVV